MRASSLLMLFAPVALGFARLGDKSEMAEERKLREIIREDLAAVKEIVDESKVLEVGEDNMLQDREGHPVNVVLADIGLVDGHLVDKSTGSMVKTSEAKHSLALDSRLPDEVWHQIKYMEFTSPAGGYLNLFVQATVRHAPEGDHHMPLHGSRVVVHTAIGRIELDGPIVTFHESTSGAFANAGFVVTADRRRLQSTFGLVGLFNNIPAFENWDSDDSPPKIPETFHATVEHLHSCDHGSTHLCDYYGVPPAYQVDAYGNSGASMTRHERLGKKMFAKVTSELWSDATSSKVKEVFMDLPNLAGWTFERVSNVLDGHSEVAQAWQATEERFFCRTEKGVPASPLKHDSNRFIASYLGEVILDGQPAARFVLKSKEDSRTTIELITSVPDESATVVPKQINANMTTPPEVGTGMADNLRQFTLNFKNFVAADEMDASIFSWGQTTPFTSAGVCNTTVDYTPDPSRPHRGYAAIPAEAMIKGASPISAFYSAPDSTTFFHVLAGAPETTAAAYAAMGETANITTASIQSEAIYSGRLTMKYRADHAAQNAETNLHGSVLMPNTDDMRRRLEGHPRESDVRRRLKERERHQTRPLKSKSTSNQRALSADTYFFDGCLKNEGDNRVGSDPAVERSIEDCAADARAAGKLFFGMEYPACCTAADTAQCRLLDFPPHNLVTAPESDCLDEKSVDDYPLGGAFRLAMYSLAAPPAPPAQLCQCYFCDNNFCPGGGTLGGTEKKCIECSPYAQSGCSEGSPSWACFNSGTETCTCDDQQIGSSAANGGGSQGDASADACPCYKCDGTFCPAGDPTCASTCAPNGCDSGGTCYTTAYQECTCTATKDPLAVPTAPSATGNWPNCPSWSLKNADGTFKDDGKTPKSCLSPEACNMNTATDGNCPDSCFNSLGDFLDPVDLPCDVTLSQPNMCSIEVGCDGVSVNYGPMKLGVGGSISADCTTDWKKCAITGCVDFTIALGVPGVSFEIDLATLSACYMSRYLPCPGVQKMFELSLEIDLHLVSMTGTLDIFEREPLSCTDKAWGQGADKQYKTVRVLVVATLHLMFFSTDVYNGYLIGA